MINPPISAYRTPSDATSNADDDEFFDAPDHFSDDDEFDDEFDDEQAPEDDVSEMVIRFKIPNFVWNNSENNEVEYVLPPNYGKLCLIAINWNSK